MRVYLPATLPTLRRWWQTGQLPAGPGCAVTPSLREWYATADAEELEHAALTAAARGSLRMLAEEPTAPRRRVVVAADAPDPTVQPRPERGRSDVHLADPLAFRAVASVHVDDPAAQDAVAAAASAVHAADLGDDDASFLVDALADEELQWYATQEIGPLVSP